MSRGKCPIDAALEIVVCNEGQANEEARHLLDVLAAWGLEQYRRASPEVVAVMPRLGEIRDAMTDFEKAIGLEYRA